VGHTYDLFPMAFGEAVLRVTTSRGGRLESDATDEEELVGRSIDEFGIKVTADGTWNTFSFYKERQKGIVDFCTSDAAENIDVFVPILVIHNEERIHEAVWRVGMTITNIHSDFLEKVCRTW
jgi:hypothetical protein